jgi:hypothetical protein
MHQWGNADTANAAGASCCLIRIHAAFCGPALQRPERPVVAVVRIVGAEVRAVTGHAPARPRIGTGRERVECRRPRMQIGCRWEGGWAPGRASPAPPPLPELGARVDARARARRPRPGPRGPRRRTALWPHLCPNGLGPPDSCPGLNPPCFGLIPTSARSWAAGAQVHVATLVHPGSPLAAFRAVTIRMRCDHRAARCKGPNGKQSNVPSGRAQCKFKASV